MCPGGFIVPTSTENYEVVVNGMSLAWRHSPYANSGMVVTVEPDDVKEFIAENGALAGLTFQKSLEKSAKHAGGTGQVAPAQKVTDFVQRRCTQTLPSTSYISGIAPARLDNLLPC